MSKQSEYESHWQHDYEEKHPEHEEPDKVYRDDELNLYCPHCLEKIPAEWEWENSKLDKEIFECPICGEPIIF